MNIPIKLYCPKTRNVSLIGVTSEFFAKYYSNHPPLFGCAVIWHNCDTNKDWIHVFDSTQLECEVQFHMDPV